MDTTSSQPVNQPSPTNVGSVPNENEQQVSPVTSNKSPSRLSYAWATLLLLVLVLIGGTIFALNLFEQQINRENEIGPNIQTIFDANKIIIGTDATFPPMEYLDTTAAMVGYDIDLGNRIAEEFGVPVEVINIPWDDLFQSLLDSKVDLVISAVTITDERKQDFDFSNPYINAGQVIITQRTNTTINSVANLSGKKIAVQAGTTNEEQALNYTDDNLVLRYPDFIGATQALVNGETDAIFSDLTNAKGIVDENPTLKIASAPFTSEFYGIAFRKGQDDLVTEINSILDTLRQQGYLLYLQQKWLE